MTSKRGPPITYRIIRLLGNLLSNHSWRIIDDQSLYLHALESQDVVYVEEADEEKPSSVNSQLTLW